MSAADAEAAGRKSHKKAEQLVKNANYQHYLHVFELIVPSKKALLVVALVAHILCATEGPYWHFPDRCLSLLLDSSVLPKHKPGKSKQKIIIFAMNGPVANILIFAQMSYNKLKDMQVKGRIYRTGQAHKCFIYKV
ncbi:uncharacterized protein SRS1_25009 [Sporisorium reilianum f. sp. reilianum]|uniref:Uncharacterized protein n=1 Tax=Sporisorium reilianum f. sp. reilianum TaxID=72559 RepID=A0A2N8UJ71_9BASI|nr:uncharacterized protein SRS1_25009 [Sporisorium reilianum f. sp. reilianum]